MSEGRFVYFSHGGGPLPILGDEGHRTMVEFMRELPKRFPKPEHILVVSAHWEESVPTIIQSESPGLFFDYYGFPPEAYTLEYPVGGDSLLGRKVIGLLETQGMAPRINQKRGFDHGVFIPLKMMYPDADIPVSQLSLVTGLDPEMHISLGTALQSLRTENILVIGSGFSFHNLREFMNPQVSGRDSSNDAFQDWLIDVCVTTPDHQERMARLRDWEKAPSARYCHPREEHLLPLHVCAAMAATPAEVIFDDAIMGKRAVAFIW